MTAVAIDLTAEGRKAPAFRSAPRLGVRGDSRDPLAIDRDLARDRSVRHSVENSGGDVVLERFSIARGSGEAFYPELLLELAADRVGLDAQSVPGGPHAGLDEDVRGERGCNLSRP